MNNSVVIHAPDFSKLKEFKITLDPAVIARRDDLVERAMAIEQVAGERSQQAAIALMVEMQDHSSGIESSRTELKKPVLELGKMIDSAARDGDGKVPFLRIQVKGLVNRFQAQKIAEQEKAAAELARLNREREQAEAAGNQEAVEKADAKAAEVVMQAAPPPKAAGQSTHHKWVIEVVNIAELYRVMPELCKPPEPRVRECEAVLNSMLNTQQEPKLPGCNVRREVDVRAR